MSAIDTDIAEGSGMRRDFVFSVVYELGTRATWNTGNPTRSDILVGFKANKGCFRNGGNEYNGYIVTPLCLAKALAYARTASQ